MITDIWSLCLEYKFDEIYSESTVSEIRRIAGTEDESYFFEAFGDVFKDHHSEEDVKKIFEEEKLLNNYFHDWIVKTNNSFNSTTGKGFHINAGDKNLDEWLKGNGNWSAAGVELKISDINNQTVLIDSKNHIVRGDIVAEWCFEHNCDLKSLEKEFPLNKNQNIKK